MIPVGPTNHRSHLPFYFSPAILATQMAYSPGWISLWPKFFILELIMEESLFIPDESQKDEPRVASSQEPQLHGKSCSENKAFPTRLDESCRVAWCCVFLHFQSFLSSCDSPNLTSGCLCEPIQSLFASANLLEFYFCLANWFNFLKIIVLIIFNQMNSDYCSLVPNL